MIAQEFKNGLAALGIKHDLTLPYSPYQNGKQEAFWGQLEGRLIAMLSNVESLTLDFLNRATQAWVEQKYNRSKHEETGQTPLERLLAGPDVSRPSVDNEIIRFQFTVKASRVQRKSDDTVQIKGVRFEIPSPFRHVRRLYIAFKPSDLSMAYLIDQKTEECIGRIFPQDKTKNAEGYRRSMEPVWDADAQTVSDGSTKEAIPPLLRKLLSDYAATGLPPAYISKPVPPTDDEQTLYNDEHLF